MRTIKLMAAVLVLALTGAVYAAGAMQDAATTPDSAQAAKNCCRKRDGAQGAAHAGTKHEGCCAGGACSKAHKDGPARAATQSPAAGDEAGCCGGDSCDNEHKGANTQSAAHGGECCCKEGGACCKAHKSDAKQGEQEASGEKAEGCCGTCCGAKAGHAAHASR